LRLKSPIDRIVTRQNIQRQTKSSAMNNAGTVLLTLADVW
jgi:hypothetical protein